MREIFEESLERKVRSKESTFPKRDWAKIPRETFHF
jgi:hypothetical protein